VQREVLKEDQHGFGRPHEHLSSWDDGDRRCRAHGVRRDQSGAGVGQETGDADGTLASNTLHAATGINDRGQIVGAYIDAGGTNPVFLCGEAPATS
jgi:hypothetical protein